MKFIDQWAYKHPRFGIDNLMMPYSIISVTFFVLYFFNISAGLQSVWWFYLIQSMFLLNTGIFWYAISILCNYFIGSTVESVYGSTKFTLYILMCFVFSFISFFIFGFSYGSMAVTMSIFIAYAVYAPDSVFQFMMVLPIKAKYLCMLYVGVSVFSELQFALQTGSLRRIAALVLCMGAPIIFFAEDGINAAKRFIRRQKYRNKLK